MVLLFDFIITVAIASLIGYILLNPDKFRRNDINDANNNFPRKDLYEDMFDDTLEEFESSNLNLNLDLDNRY